MSSHETGRRALQAFEARFGAPPSWVVRAPGRVNLIGEHTDYNDGFVLPMALDRSLWIALRPRADRQVIAGSLDLPEPVSFDLDGLARGAGWGEYLKGVAWSLEQAGHRLRGWEGVLAGDVPIGSGLSSSAALEMAAARAFAAAGELAWEPAAMARLGQTAESEWVGVRCGIMDQMISASARAGHALLIDCRTLATRAVPIPEGCVVAVLDTGTRRQLADSRYNERRAECEAAARHCGVTALRDLDSAGLAARAQGLDEVIYRRARHVVSENERTLAAAEAMQQGAAAEAGRLMNESHVSLRDDYEVSGPALDAMVALARAHPACLGARLTGAGFAGCAVALVREAQAQDFARQVEADYARQTEHSPEIMLCRPAEGAQVVEIGSLRN